MIRHIRQRHDLASRQQRLRAQGLAGLDEIAAHLGMHTATIKRYHHEGRLVGTPFNDKGECLYQIPDTPPHKKLGRPPTTNPPNK